MTLVAPRAAKRAVISSMFRTAHNVCTGSGERQESCLSSLGLKCGKERIQQQIHSESRMDHFRFGCSYILNIQLTDDASKSGDTIRSIEKVEISCIARSYHND